MVRKNNEEVIFGTVLLDTDVEDITAPFKKAFRNTIIDDCEKDVVETFCYYLTLYNNFIYEHGEEYPKYISTVDVFGIFIAVLFDISLKFKEEKIEDFKLLFEFWVDFLNTDAEVFDRLPNGSSFDVSRKMFITKISKILEQDE